MHRGMALLNQQQKTNTPSGDNVSGHPFYKKGNKGVKVVMTNCVWTNELLASASV
jgi:hypothetical protein